MDLKIRVYCGLLTALFLAVYHVQAYKRCDSPIGTCRHYWDPCPKGMIPCPDRGCKLNINYCCCRKEPAVCGGPLKGTWGVFKSPYFPYYYPQYAMCEWTTYVPRKTKLILQFSRTFALAPCDFLLISDGRKTLKITDSFKVRRCHGYKCYYDEPSSYDESANKDNGNFYNDDVDDDFYYYYDEKRNEDEDGWKTFWVSKRRRLIIVQGGNRHVIIKFKSKGCGSAKGFSVRYDKKRSRGSSSSSDEEQ
ncbi:uncharacterized protein [Porites lutea]|uniref:uncharacterized protein isoform X1 n=1 Tax=Porites lutea TaxID=51062 RepID=UPI003CC65BD9